MTFPAFLSAGFALICARAATQAIGGALNDSNIDIAFCDLDQRFQLMLNQQRYSRSTPLAPPLWFGKRLDELVTPSAPGVQELLALKRQVVTTQQFARAVITAHDGGIVSPCAASCNRMLVSWLSRG